MKYVWIEESPNTASDCGVAPPKKGDGLRSRRGNTRKVEEPLPKARAGIGVEKKLGWRTREVGMLVGVRRGWRRRRVAGKGLTRPHAPARETQSPTGKLRVAGAWMVFWFRCLHKSWRSPPGAPSGMVGVGKDVAGSSPKKFAGTTILELPHKRLLSSISKQIMSNGEYKSIEHRAVVNPEKERLSIAAFHSPDHRTMIGPLPDLTKENSANYKTTSHDDFLRIVVTRKLDGKSLLGQMKFAD
ncbi:S-norcoclaurine synthase 1 [Vitis vinifera]|uniref:S-norcoclaurine synthase 1 n=1 Tax=Vitis vinifera TaxID=29760 RepID=A0A438DYQ9_VITVI|nr:S-norcoclaurine synthase 1 [Vitis vinifera]